MGKRKRGAKVTPAPNHLEEPTHSPAEKSSGKEREKDLNEPEEQMNIDQMEREEDVDATGVESGPDPTSSIGQIVDQQEDSLLDEPEENPSEDEKEDTENENDKLEEENEEIIKKTITQEKEKEKVIDLNEIKKFGKKLDKSGLIYVSRIPPGMGPSKLKHLLSKWGQIGRIYLARDEKAEESKKNKKSKNKNGRKKSIDKHQSFLFKEGWVEFLDKKVARRVAEMLNTRPIGGKPSERYYSDLWTLTYLPKFKWSNLSDQMAIERRLKETLVRNSLEDSKFSQDWYLNMVQKNSTNHKIRQKKLKKNPSNAASNDNDNDNDGQYKGKTLQFKQRQLPPAGNAGGTAINHPNDQNSKLNSVLNGLL